MNICIHLVQVPTNFKPYVSTTSGGKTKLFAPLTLREYQGPNKDDKFTNIPFVFFDKLADTWKDRMQPGMRFEIRSRYSNYYNKDTGEETHSFVVQEIDVASWGNNGDAPVRNEESRDYDDYDDDNLDEDEFPF